MPKIKQLIREDQPPAGTPPSPLPQIYDRATEGPATVEGYHGAPGAVLFGPDGQPITTSNRLPADVTGQVSIAGDVSVVGEVDVTGEVDVSDRPGRQLGKVEATLTGTTVSIGGTEYRLLPDGNTLVGTAANKPSASAAEAVVGEGVAFFARDTRILYTSDGSDWGELL